jgi:hypothetical protein
MRLAKAYRLGEAWRERGAAQRRGVQGPGEAWEKEIRERLQGLGYI